MKYILFIAVFALSGCEYSEPNVRVFETQDRVCNEDTAQERADFILNCKHSIDDCLKASVKTYCPLETFIVTTEQYIPTGFYHTVKKELKKD